MLSLKQQKDLERSGSVYLRSGVAKALGQSEGVIPLTYDFTVQGGGTQEVTTITCVADDTDDLDATYFLLYDEAGSVGVWIDTDNSGTTIPAGASGADRALEVTGIGTDDTATDVAVAIAAIVNGDSKFTCTAALGVLTITCVDPEVVADATAGDTGFTVAVDTQGITAIPLGVPAKYTFDQDAIIMKVISQEITDVTSGGSATVALNAGSTSIVAAAAIASFTGVVNHTLAGSAVGIPVSRGDQLSIDVEVDALTAGKVRFYIYALPARDI